MPFTETDPGEEMVQWKGGVGNSEERSVEIYILEQSVCIYTLVDEGYHLGSADRWRWGPRCEPGASSLPRSAMKEVSAKDLKKRRQ